MTADQLKDKSARTLAQMAKQRGIEGWHEMRKEQLIKALVRATRTVKPSPAKAAARKTVGSKPVSGKPVAKAVPTAKVPAAKPSASRNGHVSANGKAKAAAKPLGKSVGKGATPPVARNPRQLRRLHDTLEKQAQRKDLARKNGKHAAKSERLVVMVRDPYWLHAYWEISHRGVERARAALGADWHLAKPVLRLLEVTTGGNISSSEKVKQHIEVHGGVNNWYLNVDDPPKSYRLEIGYLAASGRFFGLARSNVVNTPQPGASDAVDENWSDVAQNLDRLYSLNGGNSLEGASTELQELFEERFRRPMGSPLTQRIGVAMDLGRRREFPFDVDAELIVYGRTEPNARVTIRGEHVTLRPDGTFTVRYSLPDCRQVIPAVAYSNDGIQQRTTVLAIERNTKTMEPVTIDNAD